MVIADITNLISRHVQTSKTCCRLGLIFNQFVDLRHNRRFTNYRIRLRPVHNRAFLRESNPREIPLSVERARRFSRNLVSTIQPHMVCGYGGDCDSLQNIICHGGDAEYSIELNGRD